MLPQARGRRHRMKIRTSLAALALVPSLALAQKSPKTIEKARQVLDTTVTGMVDAVGVGESPIDTLKAKGVEPVVREDAKGLIEVREETVGWAKIRKIVFSPSIAAASPRYVSLHLAEQAARIRLEGFPESAEKDFMVLSLMSRTWMEFGGERVKLPDFDGLKDEAAAAKVQAWAENNMEGYVREASKKGKATLDGLIRAKHLYLRHCDCALEERSVMAEIRDLEKAKAEAEKFAKEEMDWFWLNKGRIQ